MASALARIKTMLLIGLGSDHDGERAAAMRMVERLLRSEGRDPHWLAERLVDEDPQARRQAERQEREDRERRERDARRRQEAEEIARMRPQDRARWALANHASSLTYRETEFLERLSRRWTDCSEKQVRWLNDIVRRLRCWP